MRRRGPATERFTSEVRTTTKCRRPAILRRPPAAASMRAFKKSKNVSSPGHLDILKARVRRLRPTIPARLYARREATERYVAAGRPWSTRTRWRPLFGRPTLYRARLYVCVESNEQRAATNAARCLLPTLAVAWRPHSTGERDACLWKNFHHSRRTAAYAKNSSQEARD